MEIMRKLSEKYIEKTQFIDRKIKNKKKFKKYVDIYEIA